MDRIASHEDGSLNPSLAFLLRIRSRYRRAVNLSAVSHWVEADMFNRQEEEGLFEKLSETPGFEPYADDRLALNSSLRQLLSEWLWEEEPEEYISLSKKLSDYFWGKRCELQIEAQNLANGPQRRCLWLIEEYEQEFLYHKFLTDPGECIGLIEEVLAGSPIDSNLQSILSEHSTAGRISHDGEVWLEHWSALADPKSTRRAAELLSRALSRMGTLIRSHSNLWTHLVQKLSRLLYENGEYTRAWDTFVRFLDQDQRSQPGCRSIAQRLTYLPSAPTELFAVGINLVDPPRKELYLLGREKEEQEVHQWLAMGAREVCVVHGMGGTGKTSLALGVVTRALQGNLIKNVIWSSGKIKTFVSGNIVSMPNRLEYPELLDVLRGKASETGLNFFPNAIVGRSDTLVILDNVEDFAEFGSQSAELVNLLGESRALLTSRMALSIPNALEIELRGLDKDAAQGVFEWSRGEEVQLETFRAVFAAVGGLPLALRHVGHASKSSPLQEVLRNVLNPDSRLLYFIYDEIWRSLSRTAKYVLVELARMGRAVGEDALTSVQDRVEGEIGSALQELKDLDLVYEEGEDELGPIYETEELTRHFALSRGGETLGSHSHR